MNNSWKRNTLSMYVSLSINNTVKNLGKISNPKTAFSSLLLGTLAVAPCVYASDMKNDVKIESKVNVAVDLPISFKESDILPVLKSVTYIKGTKKILIDFDNATELKSYKIKGNVLIDSVTVQKNGNKLRMAVEAKQPLKFNVEKMSDNNFILHAVASADFLEDTSIRSEAVNQNRNSTIYRPASKPVEKIVETTVTTNITKDITKDNIVKSNTINPSIAPIINPTINPTINSVNTTTNTTTVSTTTIKPAINNNLNNNTNSTNKVPLQVIATPMSVNLDRVNIKAENKNAKLTLDLSSDGIVPNISQSGNLLIIDLPNVTVPEEFQKNTTVSNIGTVVRNMDIATQKGSGRIVLSQDETFSYSMYQTDKKVVIEIKPSNKTVSQEKYKGKPLTFNFQNMDIRAIFQVFADFTDINVMLSDSITGTMTIRLKDVPWDQALDLILEARNLQKQKQGNVVWIATRQEIADKNKAQLELNNQAAELAPLKLEFIQLNHYKAKEMKEVLEGKGSGGEGEKDKGISLLSKRGSVGLDVRNNKLFVQDTEERLEEITKIIRKLDVASKQVVIEAKLVVVDDKFGRDFGAKFGFGLGRQNGRTGFGLSNTSPDSAGYAGATTAVSGTNNGPSYAFNMPVANAGSIGFTILNAVTGNALTAELSALEENNRGKVISKPTLLTLDNQKAEIKQGTEIPYVTPGSNNSPATVSFKEAVLSLGVTPQVSPNGRVSMSLEINKDTVGQLVNVQGGGQVPSIDTRKITTQVTIGDGQTVVLGGIYEVTNREDLSKVPLLGDIPWVGNLFKNTSKSNQKAELLIFITPHVIADEDLDAIDRNQQNKLNEIDFSIKNKK